MDDLVRFVQRSDVHRVVHAAVAHAQFETIHPYADGSGRVGRLLIHQLLGAGSVTVPGEPASGSRMKSSMPSTPSTAWPPDAT